MLDDCDHAGLHEPSGPDDLTGAGDLGNLDDPTAGRGLDSPAGTGRDDVVRARATLTDIDDNLDPIASHASMFPHCRAIRHWG